MDDYKLTLGALGLVLIGTVWLPHVLRRRVLTFPIVYVAIGYAVYSLSSHLRLPFADADPRVYGVGIERLTELVVLIALTSAGLRIDTPIGWVRWNSTWRLLGIAMPLCMLAGVALGYLLLGVSLAAALLIGAALAPTDPVLAADVQVGPPGVGKEDAVRLALTSEAGLNDGLAFPFVWLAIAVATAASGDPGWLPHWLWYDLGYRVLAGVAIGWGLGYLLMHLMFRVAIGTRLAQTEDGLTALAVTLLVYGVSEALGGYGFLAVFVAAVAIRHHERGHEFHHTLDRFAGQCERLLMTAVLLLFGAALANGILDELTWRAALFGLLFVLVARPLSGMIAFLGSAIPWRERLAISGFGVRGVGSIYYLAFALNTHAFPMARLLWATVSFVVLLSVIVHGLTGTPIMRGLDGARALRRRELLLASRSPSTE